MWVTLGDEHINHMLLAMLIKEDENFLSDFIASGTREIKGFGFGDTFDLEVDVADARILLEVKTWSKFSQTQKAPDVFKKMERCGAERIVYILLERRRFEEQQGWKKDDRMKVVSFPILLHALESTPSNAPTRAIATDYAEALRELKPMLWGD